ncbi:MAG TPA: HAD-IA family hydrolase [Gemmatimonadales bacterium]|nr:HAD-IA family hydrolase [Gemmatimonadales bacterium]
MATLTTFLFDLDGTILDSIGHILDSYRHTFAVHGLPPAPEEELVRGIGTPLRSQLAKQASDPALLDALVATYREYNLKYHDERIFPYPGVVEAIRAIRAAGRRTGLVTSKNRQGALRGLQLAGLQYEIDVVVGCDEVENPKPHREPVDKAVALLGADPATTVYVGDSVHDMRCGRAAGVRTAAALWGPFTRGDLAPTEPDYWLERPADLLRLLA